MENTLISISADVAVIVSASVATIALALSAFALREVKNSQQFNIINSVLNDIHQIDSEVINLLTVYEDKKNIQLTRDSMNQLLAKLFNKIDWISFLINHEQIKNDSIKKYLHRLIKSYYESTYTNLATDQMRSKSEYKEFKELYQKIKN